MLKGEAIEFVYVLQSIFYAGMPSATNEEAQAHGSEWLARGAHEIAEGGDVGSVGTDATCIDRETQAFGEVQVHARVVQLRETKACRGLHAVHSGRIDRARRTMALPGSA